MYNLYSALTEGINNQLDLTEGSRYFSILRVTNAFGYIYTIRSNGVTLSSSSLLPGSVYDGEIPGYDLSILKSTSMATANWDGFGQLSETVEVSDILAGKFTG